MCGVLYAEEPEYYKITEFSFDYYPDIFFTLETNNPLKRDLLSVTEKRNEISEFDFKEEITSEKNKVEFLIVSEYSQEDLVENRYLIHDKLLELQKKLELLHDDVKVTVALFDGQNFISEKNQDKVIFDLSGVAKSEKSDERILSLEYSTLTEEISNEFDMRSEKKYILYFSGYSKLLDTSNDTNAAYNRYSNFEQFKKDQEKLGVQTFLCNENLLNTSDKFIDDIYHTINLNTYNYLYKYYFGYRVPLVLNLTEVHRMSLQYAGEQLINYDYQLNYSADNHFILDVTTTKYPSIEFSYYNDGQSINEKNLVLYENYKKNDYFGETVQQNEAIDIVFVVEDSFYSKIYNNYLLNELQDFIDTLEEKGYSLRIGLVRYSDSAEINHILSYNTEKVMKSFSKNEYSCNGFDFYSALEAIVKASEMNFLSYSSRNVIFFQAADTFFFDENRKILPDSVEKALLSRNINFFSFSNHAFFEELNYRVSGNTVMNTSSLSSLINYISFKNDFDFYALNTSIGEEADLILFDSGRLIKSNYLISLDDVKDNFRINTITAAPFVARRGEEVILNCKTNPTNNVSFFWEETGENGIKNFRDGNQKRSVTWIAPMKKGYYTLSVKVEYRNYSLDGEVVVLVE